MKDYGLVSIITPTWGCGAYIGETIKSVLSQTYQNWEMLVQDDCSTDGTKDVVLKYAASDCRIKYMCNDVNSGAAVTRNNALRRAVGRWVAFLDADDLWFPEKLEHQLQFMVANDYAFSYHSYSEISEEGSPLGVRVCGKKCVGKFDMYACCWPGCLTVMYDAAKVGLVQVADIKKNNDTAMWLKIVDKYHCHFLDEELALYRRRDGSITPKPLYQRVLAHYPLFRIAEGMNPVVSAFWVVMNVFGNAFKKAFYVKSVD